MGKVLYFEQITDDRFDADIYNLLEKRVAKIKELLDIDGIEVTSFPIEKIHFNEHINYWKDGTIAYISPANNQCRCGFYIKKNTRKISWNDIYRLVNSVKAVSYKFR